MNTAQTVLTQGAATAQRKTILPWIIGGVVVVVALLIIWKL